MKTSSFLLPELSKRQSLPEELAAIMMRQIEEGEFKTGDVLPSEQALAQAFNVSRTVIREALARLKFEGIIESKRGSGPVVLSTAPLSNMSLPMNLSTPEEKAKVIEFRIIMEGESAALAAVRRTEEQLEQMLEFLEHMQAAVDQRKSGTMPDFRFHILIAESAHNEYINRFIQFFFSKMWSGVHEARSLSNQDYQRARVVLEEHWLIYQTIKEGVPHAARTSVQDHLINSARRQSVPLSGPLLYACRSEPPKNIC